MKRTDSGDRLITRFDADVISNLGADSNWRYAEGWVIAPTIVTGSTEVI